MVSPYAAQNVKGTNNRSNDKNHELSFSHSKDNDKKILSPENKISQPPTANEKKRSFQFTSFENAQNQIPSEGKLKNSITNKMSLAGNSRNSTSVTNPIDENQRHSINSQSAQNYNRNHSFNSDQEVPMKKKQPSYYLKFYTNKINQGTKSPKTSNFVDQRKINRPLSRQKKDRKSIHNESLNRSLMAPSGDSL